MEPIVGALGLIQTLLKGASDAKIPENSIARFSFLTSPNQYECYCSVFLFLPHTNANTTSRKNFCLCHQTTGNHPTPGFPSPVLWLKDRNNKKLSHRERAWGSERPQKPLNCKSVIIRWRLSVQIIPRADLCMEVILRISKQEPTWAHRQDNPAEGRHTKPYLLTKQHQKESGDTEIKLQVIQLPTYQSHKICVIIKCHGKKLRNVCGKGLLVSAARSWSDNLTDEGVSPTFKVQDWRLLWHGAAMSVFEGHLTFISLLLKTSGVLFAICEINFLPDWKES